MGTLHPGYVEAKRPADVQPRTSLRNTSARLDREWRICRAGWWCGWGIGDSRADRKTDAVGIRARQGTRNHENGLEQLCPERRILVGPVRQERHHSERLVWHFLRPV